MSPKLDGSNSIKKSIVFYLILICIVVLSTYFSIIAFVAYFLIMAVLYILKKKEGGFIWGSSWKLGFLYGLILILSIFLLESLLGWVKLDELVPGAFYILAGGLIFELLVSLGEEMSFRGYILPNLMENMGRRGAVISSSILFAGLHIPSILDLDIKIFNALIMFTTVFVAGVILSRLYLTGGLKMAVGFHFSWNFFQYHVFSLRAGFGIFGISAVKPEFTGGPAGPEAGLAGLTVLLLGAAILQALYPDIRKA
jgi:membrane protease YdiL (CAAX protease family)